MFVTTVVGTHHPLGEPRRASQLPATASRSSCEQDGSVREIETEGSLPLGILPKVSYRQGKLDLHPGDWLVSLHRRTVGIRNPAISDMFLNRRSSPHSQEGSSRRPRDIIDRSDRGANVGIVGPGRQSR